MRRARAPSAYQRRSDGECPALGLMRGASLAHRIAASQGCCLLPAGSQCSSSRVISSEGRLRRALRLPDVVLFFVVAVVGLRWIATAAASGPSGLVLWLIALVTFFLPLGFAVVELASRHPEEGGIYVWAQHA